MSITSIEIEKTNKIIIAEWITTIGILLTCFIFLLVRMEKQSERTDKLYEMFCDLQKSGDQKFYDLLKDRK